MTGVLRHPQKSQGPDRHWGHDISNFGAHYGELTEIIICECLYCKNGLILPTGQWYAPSAVIKDAGYCVVLHCIA